MEAAPAAELLAIVADPRRHRELDGSGTVRGNIKVPAKLLAVGSKFSTKMKLFGLLTRRTKTNQDSQSKVHGMKIALTRN